MNWKVLAAVLVIIVSVVYAFPAFMRDQNTLEKNGLEVNVPHIHPGTNAIEINVPELNRPSKPPRYQPVSTNEKRETDVDVNPPVTTAMHKAGEKLKQATSRAENRANKAVKEAGNAAKKAMHSTGKREGASKQSGTRIRYRRSDTVAIPVPVVQEAHGMHEEKKELNVNGVSARVECHGRACVVKLPKSAIKERKIVLEDVVHRALAEMQEGAKVIKTEVIDRNGFVVAKAVAVEKNMTKVLYATADQGSFAVIVKIPKSEVPDPSLIDGNVIFLQTDPVLKIYLKAENNSVAIAGYTVKKDVNITSQDSIAFAVCSVRIGDVRVNVESKSQTIQFKVYDGQSAVYIPNVRVVGAATSVRPQYDDSTKTYTATVPAGEAYHIVASVAGCGEISYYVQPPKETSSIGPAVAAIIFAVAALAGWYLWRR